MVAEDVAMEAQRNILLGWGDLPESDLSIIRTCLAQEDAHVVTSSDTPHGRFWAEVVRLGWAERCAAPLEVAPALPDAVVFRPTERGRKMLVRFIDHRRLFDSSAWNHAAAGSKPAMVIRHDGSLALLDPTAHPLNLCVMSETPDRDKLAAAMTQNGCTVVRVKPTASVLGQIPIRSSTILEAGR